MLQYRFGNDGPGQMWTSAENFQDRLNQPSMLKLIPNGGSSQDVAAFKYNGARRLVEADYVVPDVRRQMFNIDSAGANDYNGWDRYGRTIFHYWDDYASSLVPADRYGYDHDFGGNRKLRDNRISGAAGLDRRYT